MATSKGFAALTAGISVGLCAAVPGQAQDNSTSGANANIQEVVVTGSRIRRPETFDSAVPLATIGGDALNASGFTVLGDALNTMPQGLVNSNLQNTAGTLFNAGQSRVDLRGLGSTRTLVLVDGRRHLTGDFRTSAVDLNMIPSTMVDRIDAVSGGSSAVYGSEAIAGVVNVILKRKMDGLVLDFQGGMTGDDDGEEWKASAGYGIPFADGRGSFLIGGEYGKVEPIMQVDRDWAFPGVRRNTLGTPQNIVPNSRTNTLPTATFQLRQGTAAQNNNDARSVSIALDRSSAFANDADCRPQVVRPTCQDSRLFYGATYNALQIGLERSSVRTYADFDFTDNLKLFGDVSYSKVTSTAIFQPAFSNAQGGGTLPASIRGDNAFLNGTTPLAQQVRALWVAEGLALNQATNVFVGKFWQEFGNRDSDTSRHSIRAITGLEGNFGLFAREFDWDVSAQYSKLEGFTLAHNVPSIAKTLAAIDAVNVGGQIVCRNPNAQALGCVPWDLINGPSAAAVAWANADARADGEASQTVVNANLSTSLFDLPAGPLGFAIGAEYREEDSDQIQDPLSASGALFYNGLGRTRGDYDIIEGYAEFVVPILADLPFAKQLSIEAAGRVGDYSSVGDVSQWRLQSTWAPVEDVSFRASKSTSVRAPNITDLFAPQGRNFTTAANDPCDNSQVRNLTGQRLATRVANCQATIPGYTTAFVSNFGTGRSSLALLQGGNPDLFEETANTESLGVVLRPRWVNNLSFSFDYWNIEVEDAISVIPINTLLVNLCYDVAQDPASNPFCGFVQRDATGASTGGLVGGVTQVVLTNQNVQAIETSGVDMALQYSVDLGAPGTFQFRGDATRVIRWDLQGVPGGTVTHYAGKLPGVNGSVPRWKFNGTVGWAWRDLSVQWQSRYQDTYEVSEVLPNTAFDPYATGVYWEHDLRVSYKWNESLSLRAGLINATDEHPPLIPEVGNATGTGGSTYDNRGRWFFVGASYSFKPTGRN